MNDFARGLVIITELRGPLRELNRAVPVPDAARRGKPTLEITPWPAETLPPRQFFAPPPLAEHPLLRVLPLHGGGLLALVVMINYLGARYFLRFSISAQSRAPLAPQTLTLLKSPSPTRCA